MKIKDMWLGFCQASLGPRSDGSTTLGQCHRTRPLWRCHKCRCWPWPCAASSGGSGAAHRGRHETIVKPTTILSKRYNKKKEHIASSLGILIESLLLFLSWGAHIIESHGYDTAFDMHSSRMRRIPRMKDGALPTVVWMLLAMHSCAEQSGDLVRPQSMGPMTGCVPQDPVVHCPFESFPSNNRKNWIWIYTLNYDLWVNTRRCCSRIVGKTPKPAGSECLASSFHNWSITAYHCRKLSIRLVSANPNDWHQEQGYNRIWTWFNHCWVRIYHQWMGTQKATKVANSQHAINLHDLHSWQVVWDYLLFIIRLPGFGYGSEWATHARALFHRFWAAWHHHVCTKFLWVPWFGCLDGDWDSMRLICCLKPNVFKAPVKGCDKMYSRFFCVASKTCHQIWYQLQTR